MSFFYCLKMIELGRKKENKMKKEIVLLDNLEDPQSQLMQVLLESFIKLNIAKNMKMFME